MACHTTEEYRSEQLIKFSHAMLDEALSNAPKKTVHFYRTGLPCFLGGNSAIIFIWMKELAPQLYILGIGIAMFGGLQLIAGHLQKQNKVDNGFFHVMEDLSLMPKTMKQLAVVQFLSWFALFSMWIYGTSAVTSYHYGTTDTTSTLYNEGADWVGILFATYNGFAAVAAIAIPFVIRATNRKIAHMLNLCLGGVGLISFVFIRDPIWLLLPMVGIGFAWASILSLPYAMLSRSVPTHKMGLYAGIFNLFIVIPQILAASILALVVHALFDDKTIYALVCAGMFMFFAAFATLFVDDDY